ncbi:Protein of unknown function [Gryllus bimaculatus]|nr:Protein of unknown function [Gryllus bimaculatus]
MPNVAKKEEERGIDVQSDLRSNQPVVKNTSLAPIRIWTAVLQRACRAERSLPPSPPPPPRMRCWRRVRPLHVKVVLLDEQELIQEMQKRDISSQRFASPEEAASCSRGRQRPRAQRHQRPVRRRAPGGPGGRESAASGAHDHARRAAQSGAERRRAAQSGAERRRAAQVEAAQGRLDRCEEPH